MRGKSADVGRPCLGWEGALRASLHRDPHPTTWTLAARPAGPRVSFLACKAEPGTRTFLSSGGPHTRALSIRHPQQPPSLPLPPNP